MEIYVILWLYAVHATILAPRKRYVGEMYPSNRDSSAVHIVQERWSQSACNRNENLYECSTSDGLAIDTEDSNIALSTFRGGTKGTLNIVKGWNGTLVNDTTMTSDPKLIDTDAAIRWLGNIQLETKGDLAGISVECGDITATALIGR